MAGKLAWALEISGVDQAAQKLRDLDKIASTLNKDITSTQGFGGFLNNMSATMRKLNPQLVQMRKDMTDAGKPATALGAFVNQSLGIGAGQNVFRGHGRKAYEAFWKGAVEAPKDPNRFKNLFLGLGSAPFSPWISARFFSDAAKGFAGGGNGGGIGAALFGKGGSLAFGEFYIAVSILNRALKSGAKAIEDAISTGYKLYTGAAQEGLSRQFFGRRQAIADILNVSGNPNQIFMFGNAVEDLTKRISASTDLIARNAPAMAQVGMNAKVLKLDFSAFASELSKNATPAISLFMSALDILVKKLTASAFIIERALEFTMTGIAGSWISKLITRSGGTLSQFNSPAPTLMPFMKQLPVSSLEKMGLVIGGVQTNMVDYARRTAIGIEKLVAHTTGPSRVPRQFGMSPTVANP